jgi:outer membrane protein
MNRKSLILVLLCGFSRVTVNAQDTLQLRDIISKTLSSNYQMAMSTIQTKQAENLATYGQAGFFPQINANGIGAFSQNNTQLEFAGGLPDVERKGAVNTQIGGNIGLNYTVFNGFGRVYTYRNLIQQFQLSQLQAQVVAENLVFEGVNRFVNLQQARVNSQLALRNMELSRERLVFARKGYETGSKLTLDVLTAELDVLNDSMLWWQAHTLEEKERYALNVLMGEAPLTPVSVGLEMPVPVLESTEVLVDKVRNSGSSVLLAKLSMESAQTQSDLAQSRIMPNLSINANYGFLNAQNGAGIILAQRNVGFNSTANLVVPLYNGKQLRTAIKNAQLDVDRKSLEWKQAQLQAEQMLHESLADQHLMEQQIIASNLALSVATRAWERAKEAYQSGQIRYTDLRAAQVAKLQAESTMLNAQLNLMRLRYAILRFTGALLNTP